jgi:DNA-directed RNA polymerase subunit M/transcription elongation factor TFIIS
MAKYSQRQVADGEMCTCNKCKLQFAKNPDNFYYRSNNIIRTYVCKGCYYLYTKARLYECRAKAKEPKPERKDVLLSVVKTRTFPKGHPMNPTKEQRQALIDKIDSRRVYKNESRND